MEVARWGLAGGFGHGPLGYRLDVTIVLVLWGSCLALGFLLAWASRRMASRSRDAHPTAVPAAVPVSVPRYDGRPMVQGTSQVLFAASDGEALRMDCVLIGDDAVGASRGSLMTVRLYPPKVPSQVTPFETILERWADEVRVVDLQLRPCAGGWRLRLDDGHARVNLEISEPTSVG